jgi:flavin-dependent dehydrogenase
VTHRADVAILGGGPAGAALAILLAEQGCDVALFEQHTFPRFHIGESLIPAVNRTLARLGVLDRLDRHGFPRKHGVQFFNQTTPTRPFYFREATDAALHSTWQVERSEFDAMLLQRAREVGARVHTSARVAVAGDSGGAFAVSVVARQGCERTIDARIFVDASGQHGVLARRCSGWRRMPELHNAAVFAHYRHVDLDPGIDAGSTLVYRLDAAAWLWLIPLPDVVSIGIVAPPARLHDLGKSPEAILAAAIAASPLLAARLRRARRATPVRTARDFTYRAHRDGGRGWLLIGDALGFIDPIYSTGLFLALRSAEQAAPAIVAALASGSAPPDLAGFARDYDIAFDRFLTLVRAFYCDAFHFGAFARQGERRRGLVDMLTGDVSTAAAVDVVQAVASDLEALGRGQHSGPRVARGGPR